MRKAIFGAAAVFLLLAGCVRKERVALAIDFSQAFQWNYSFAIDVSGNVASGGSSRSFTNSLRTTLAGEQSPHDRGAVKFKTGPTEVRSDFLDEHERADLERRCCNLVLFFSPREGAVEPVDTARLPDISLGGWNVLRSFIRIVPVLPESPQAVGSSWERERSFPVETSLGSGRGWLYQAFTFDSITARDSSRCASITWRFSYRVQPDSPGHLDSMPLAGAGRGSALLDLKGKRLLSADAVFAVPPRKGASQEIAWRETVHLELVSGGTKERAVR